MILTFSKPEFIDKITQGSKIHTIRQDFSNRWKPGRKIDFWLGNPRHTTSHPYAFNQAVCHGTEYIAITRSSEHKVGYVVTVSQDGTTWKLLTPAQTRQLAHNDGLTTEEFYCWFLTDSENFFGKIIHWTQHRYSN
ncbi:hypothetical protein QNI16_18360 [Cytophagaceae bacterium YF14B1]|uniref:Uncharacterized protein n=1 Tax=Xanthocytophaga flava TaxID=3048013 RepID=A0AAE3QS87_9BACT|nr:hypothetical protein [Xanthocytophaga flavus]MDJ1482473.1 hypothetical protein [Xanthocytophaga flavus]